MGTKTEKAKNMLRKATSTPEGVCKDFQLGQQDIEAKIQCLIDKREQLRNAKYKLVEESSEKNKQKIALIEMKINDITSDIKELRDEAKKISEKQELYSRTIKNKKEAASAMLKPLTGAAGIVLSGFLGRKALDKAYECDVEGGLRNKGVLEFFKTLNPTKMLNMFNPFNK